MKNQIEGALEFMRHEAAGGVVLMIAAVLALAAANSPLAGLYDGFLDTPVVVKIGALELAKPLLLWINDGLMAIFFLLVAMEIKRELLTGELSSFDRAVLPAIAAAGGMAAPAAIYAAINWSDAEALRGWAIPSATDIAFAVGVLALLGSRVPSSIKIFLLALAILDDLGAIVVIAVFYTDKLSLIALLLALAGASVLWLFNVRNIARIVPYVLVGVFIWVCVLKSGVHATLAGVVVGLAIPLTMPVAAWHGKAEGTAEKHAPLEHLEETLHPWVAFGVLPLFAFANAGVSLAGLGPSTLLAPVPLGIALGLLVGKTVGIFGATWLAVQLGVASRPEGATWPQVVGAAMLGGVGFTMSLFIGMLAFSDPVRLAEVRIGVLAGSIVAAACGYLLLARTAATAASGNAAS